MTDADPPVPPAIEPPSDPSVTPESTGPAPGLGLLGIEIGANAVRLVLLDSEASTVTDAVERPVGLGDGDLDRTAELHLQTALLAALDAIGLSEPTPLLMGVTVGMANCGVGSGPALRDWLENLSGRLEQPFLCAGTRGVSYAPAEVVAFLRRLFEPLPLHLDRIELAPVAASRVIPALEPGAITLGSGVAWSARVFGNEVLEAYEIAGGPIDQVLSVSDGTESTPIERLEGVEVDPELVRQRDLTVGALAPAVGVALALRTSPPTNLLAAQSIGASPAAVPAARPVPIPVDDPDPVAAGARARGGPGLAPDDRSAAPQRWDPAGGDAWNPGDVRNGRGGDPYAYDEGYDDYRNYDDYDGTRWNREARAGSAGPAGRRPAGRPEPDGGFHVSDFALGALLMLAVVLTLALVFL